MPPRYNFAPTQLVLVERQIEQAHHAIHHLTVDCIVAASKAAFAIVATVCLLPVIYVLAFGPYLWLHTHNYVPASVSFVLDWIYRPLVDAAGKYPLINQLLGLYLGLFLGE